MQINQKRLANRRRITGQGMTEYIIIVAMIALAAIAAVGAFGGVVKDQFTAMATKLTGEEPGAVAVEEAADPGATTLKSYAGG